MHCTRRTKNKKAKALEQEAEKLLSVPPGKPLRKLRKALRAEAASLEKGSRLLFIQGRRAKGKLLYDAPSRAVGDPDLIPPEAPLPLEMKARRLPPGPVPAPVFFFGKSLYLRKHALIRRKALRPLSRKLGEQRLRELLRGSISPEPLPPDTGHSSDGGL